MNELNNNAIYTGANLTGGKNEISAPVLNENDEIIELGDDFDFNGFQVVRREFFAAVKEKGVPVLKLHAEAFARRIALDFGEADVLLEDNFFDLQPGQHKTIRIEEIRSPQGTAPEELVEGLRIFSNYDLNEIAKV